MALPRRTTSLPILCLTLFCPVVRAADDRRVEAARLIEQARELTDIRSTGSSAFRLVARVQLQDEKGQLTEGSYKLLWQSPTVWRAELTAPNFSETRVARNGVLFIKRDPSYLTLQMMSLNRLMDFPDSALALGSEEINEVKEITVNGSARHSVEITYRDRSVKTIFLDVPAPLPLRVEFSHANLGIQFENYVQFGAHQFPRTLVRFRKNKALITATVLELAPLASPAEDAFMPPNDSHWVRWCRYPDPPRPVAAGKVLPIPDSPSRQLLKAHVVVIYGVIGIDGLWHNTAIVESGGRTADSFWLNFLSRQRFHPAACEGNPVEFETVMSLFLP